MRIVRTALAFSLSLSAVAAAQTPMPRSAAPLSSPPRAVGVIGAYPAPAASMCNGRGRPVAGLCACAPGWTGANCEAPAGSMCSGHGVLLNNRCVCSTYWMGPDCSMAGFSLSGMLIPH